VTFMRDLRPLHDRLVDLLAERARLRGELLGLYPRAKADRLALRIIRSLYETQRREQAIEKEQQA